jgi:hypothetical protein
MARLSIKIAHGMSPEAAKAQFREAIYEARTRYIGWIERLVWTEDGHSATVVGPGFEVRCWCDECDLHVEGSIPLTWKFFESVLRSKIKRDIDRALVNRH